MTSPDGRGAKPRRKAPGRPATIEEKIRSLKHSLWICRQHGPGEELDSAVFPNPDTLADLTETWLVGLSKSRNGYPIFFLAEPDSALVKELRTDAFQNDFQRVSAISDWMNAIRSKVGYDELQPGLRRFRISANETVDVSKPDLGHQTLEDPRNKSAAADRWNQLEVNLGDREQSVLGVYMFGETVPSLDIAERNLRDSARAIRRRSKWDEENEVSPQKPDAVDVGEWSITGQIEIANKALEALLPSGNDKSQTWNPSTGMFSRYNQIEAHKFVEGLRENGWSADDLRNWSSAGEGRPYLVLAAYQLEAEFPDETVFGAALTAYRHEFVLAEKAVDVAGFRQLYAIVMAFVRQWKNIPNSANDLPARFSSFDRFRSLLKLAPWLSLLPQPSHDENRVRVSIEQLGELAALSTTSFAAPNGEVLDRNGAELANRIELIEDFEFSDPDVGQVIEVSSLAFQSRGESNERLAELPEEIKSRLLKLNSVWPTAPPREVISESLVAWVDVRQKCTFALNLSTSHSIAVRIGQEADYFLQPFHPERDRYTQFATATVFVSPGTVLRVAGCDDFPVQDGLGTPPPDLETDSAAAGIATRYFIGRENEIANLRKYLLPRNRDARRPAVIHGNRRAGKTTLARHVLATAFANREISANVSLDVIEGANASGTAAEGYPPRLAKALYRSINKGLSRAGIGEVVLPTDIEDPVDFLVEVDDLWPEGRAPLGLLLDELDSFFYHGRDTPLYGLATRLGNLQLRNIALLGTVQRHGHEADVLKEWGAVRCLATLSWGDALRYFSGVGEAPGSVVRPAYKPIVSPSDVSRSIVSYLGYRPYFWGQLYSKLEGVSLGSGKAIMSQEDIGTATEDMLLNDTLLALFSARADGLSHTEARRRDVFTDDELAVLSLFCDGDKDEVADARISKVFGADRSAVSSLIEREMLYRKGDLWILTSRIFGEYIRAQKWILNRSGVAH